MPKVINLINAETQKTFEFLRLKKKLGKLSVASVVLFLVVVSLTTFFLLATKAVIERNQSKIAILQQEIKSLDKNESYVVTIADRITQISSLLGSKRNLSDNMADLHPLMVPGFALSGFEMKSAKELLLTGFCADLQSLTNLQEKVEQLARKNLYQSIYYSQVTRLSDGHYDLILGLKN